MEFKIGDMVKFVGFRYADLQEKIAKIVTIEGNRIGLYIKGWNGHDLDGKIKTMEGWYVDKEELIHAYTKTNNIEEWR